MRQWRVVFSPDAQADLQWLYDAIATAANRVTAMRYLDRIEARCRGLEYASERGNRRDDIRPGLRVVGFERRVTVAFVVETDHVVILRLFYGGANWEEAF